MNKDKSIKDLRKRNDELQTKLEISTIREIHYNNLYYKSKEEYSKLREDVLFCINNMKCEYACIDKRTARELHTMVGLLEDSLKRGEWICEKHYTNISKK